MPTIIGSSTNESNFTPHPAGSFMAVCADVFTQEQPNMFKGSVRDDGSIDERDTITNVCMIFLTEETEEVKGEVRPRQARMYASATMGSADRPSNLRKFLKGWFTSLTDEKIDEGIVMDKMIGMPAYLTVTQKTNKAGKLKAYASAAAKPPKDSNAPQIPTWFKRHEEKPQTQQDPPPAEAPVAQEEMDDLPF